MKKNIMKTIIIITSCYEKTSIRKIVKRKEKLCVCVCVCVCVCAYKLGNNLAPAYLTDIYTKNSSTNIQHAEDFIN